MFKKIAFATLLATSTLFAGGSHLNIGGSSFEIGDADPQYGAEIGGDLMFGMDQYQWIEAGVSGNIGSVFFDNSFDQLDHSYAPYGTLNLKLGFDFSQIPQDQDLPFSIGAMIGYGGGKIDNDYFHGMTYGGSFEVAFSQNYGLGYTYEAGTVEVFGKDQDLQKHKIYLTIKFIDNGGL